MPQVPVPFQLYEASNSSTAPNSGTAGSTNVHLFLFLHTKFIFHVYQLLGESLLCGKMLDVVQFLKQIREHCKYSLCLLDAMGFTPLGALKKSKRPPEFWG